ncbi:hypothetical protein SAMN04490248_11246 [Salinihabitans flavidus]|uniref:DUF2125 domain-containing protein n=2 Tax=Salinihabitans flavidus TaxID=569882 RepID=A0A1H8SI30_9RHOB|nr:hypothetical protein SAMN04490248_11246 [Salinihabitans flavidus]
MKKLAIAIIALGLAWSVFWAVQAHDLRRDTVAWFEDRRAEGWHAEYDDLTLRGFPNRLDLSFSDLSLADTGSGLAWEMPFFQLLRLSYRPDHLIAVWPDEQVIASPGDKHMLRSEDMRASLVLGDGAHDPLERTNLVITEAALSDDAGRTMRADNVNLAIRHETGQSYRLAVTTEGFAPAALPATGLPNRFTTLRADLTATFDRPWDARALTVARPQPTRINLRLAEVKWGDLELHAAGELEIDSAGTPSGRITVRARNWREIVALARTSGRLPETVLDTVEQGLDLLSGLSGNGRMLDIPLTFRGGQIRIGPVPIAKAPTLRLR